MDRARGVETWRPWVELLTMLSQVFGGQADIRNPWIEQPQVVRRQPSLTCEEFIAYVDGMFPTDPTN